MNKVAAGFICILLSVAPLTLADGPLESLLEVFRVEQTATEDGVVEKLVAADESEPSSILEYVLTYTNVGESSLQGFVIKNPVPANTTYVADSANASVAARFLVSIDNGETYESEPVTRIIKDENGNDKEIVIPPDQYTAVRWEVTESLSPEAKMSMRYRVTID